jgi:hypothetical protein
MANNTTQQAAETAEATGLLDQAIGPVIEFWQGLPPAGKIAVIGLGAGSFLLYTWFQNRDRNQQLEATDWEEKFDNLFKIPTAKAGRKTNVLLLNQSDTAGKRTIGAIKKLNTSKVDISSEQLEEGLNDEEEWEELKENGDLDIAGVTYEVVPGSKRIDRIFSTIAYKLAGIFSKGSNPQAQYWDLTDDEIKVTDQGVVIDKDVHFFKENGLWQTDNTENQERKIQLTSTVQLQNYLESLQKHPEFYSDLNMNISGVKNIENTKSKNMREYKRQEKMDEKREAIEE